MKLDVVEVDNGCYKVYLKALQNFMVVNALIGVLHKFGIRNGAKKIILDLNDCEPPSFPNVILSIRGLIDLYKREYNIDVVLDYEEGSYIDKVNIDTPYNISGYASAIQHSVFDKVISFKVDHDIEVISTALLKQLQESVICQDGVIVGISWCINEVMDNVLNHSGAEEGLIMCQVHKKRNHVAFSIFDNGKGLYNTLSDTKHNPKDSLEAIKLALKAGVTRDNAFGQGNGMWGLDNIVKANLGNLTIYSGNGMSRKDYRDDNPYNKEFDNLSYPSKRNQMTLVEFSIDFDREINIYNVLGNYEPFEIIQKKYEDDLTDDDYINVVINDETTGTGTRQAGSKLRTYINNIIIQEKKKVQLDFNDIDHISSSFADEFVGKMVVSFGFMEFNRLFKIVNYNDYVKILLDKAIKQRMSETTNTV